MNKYEQFVRDAAAYVRWSLDHGISASSIVATLSHDLGGLESGREFTPRVDGYGQRDDWRPSHE